MGVLLSSYQKYYSALLNLERFNKDNDFYDNISCLDTFFSEYRNITFVLQKSISKDVKLNEIYDRLRTKYLKNSLSKWFLDKRNETIKKHPFQLLKQIHISVYLPNATLALPVEEFTIENDEPFSYLEDPLKIFFCTLKQAEIHFSAKYVFRDKGSDINLIEQLLEGVKNIGSFLNEFREEINERCKYSDRICEKISELNVLNMPPDILFCADYLYVVNKNTFEHGSYGMMLIPGIGCIDNIRSDLKYFDYIFKQTVEDVKKPKDRFIQFVSLHVALFKQQHQSIMPTFMIIYEDGTYSMMPFSFSIRTTLYRKVNEIAERIPIDKIDKIFYVGETYQYSGDNTKKLLLMPHEERIKYFTEELLMFFNFEKHKDKQILKFDISKINDLCYVAQIMHNMTATKPEISLNFFGPIESALK